MQLGNSVDIVSEKPTRFKLFNNGHCGLDRVVPNADFTYKYSNSAAEWTIISSPVRLGQNVADRPPTSHHHHPDHQYYGIWVNVHNAPSRCLIMTSLFLYLMFSLVWRNSVVIFITYVLLYSGRVTLSSRVWLTHSDSCFSYYYKSLNKPPGKKKTPELPIERPQNQLDVHPFFCFWTSYCIILSQFGTTGGSRVRVECIRSLIEGYGVSPKMSIWVRVWSIFDGTACVLVVDSLYCVLLCAFTSSISCRFPFRLVSRANIGWV